MSESFNLEYKEDDNKRIFELFGLCNEYNRQKQAAERSELMLSTFTFFRNTAESCRIIVCFSSLIGFKQLILIIIKIIVSDLPQNSFLQFSLIHLILAICLLIISCSTLSKVLISRMNGVILICKSNFSFVYLFSYTWFY